MYLYLEGSVKNGWASKEIKFAGQTYDEFRGKLNHYFDNWYRKELDSGWNRQQPNDERLKKIEDTRKELLGKLESLGMNKKVTVEHGDIITNESYEVLRIDKSLKNMELV